MFMLTFIHQVVVAVVRVSAGTNGSNLGFSFYNMWTVACPLTTGQCTEPQPSISMISQYLGCAQEWFVKSTLPVPNSLHCCQDRLLLWASTHSKCWELWWNRGCVLRSDCAKDAERKHSADCYASRVIWFSKGSLMVGFSCMLQILKRQHKQCRSHICTDQDPTLASNTRKTLSRLSKVAYSIWRWRGWNIVAAVWISTPPIACVYAVGAQHNNTTTVGWQAGTERWLKNDMPSHSCA